MSAGKATGMPQQRHSRLTAAKPAAKMNGLVVEAEVRRPAGRCFSLLLEACSATITLSLQRQLEFPSKKLRRVPPLLRS
jgi:hypothetical protein